MDHPPWWKNPRWYFIVRTWDKASCIVKDQRFMFEQDARAFAKSFISGGGYRVEVYPVRYHNLQTQRGGMMYPDGKCSGLLLGKTRHQAPKLTLA